MLRNTNFSWRCPFCDQNATISPGDFHARTQYLEIANSQGNIAFVSEFVVCPNPDCKKIALDAGIYPFSARTDGSRRIGVNAHQVWQLIPESNAKVYPSYIPQAVREDYSEACRIRALSPKSAAALARRALQGMIRDFWSINQTNLKAAIDAIEENVDPLTWQAIEGVRTVGNIGAHMEKDIDLIIEVEPQEAELLIGLVETLLADWYVARHDRDERMKAIVAIAAEKKNEQQATQVVEEAADLDA